MKKKVHTMAEYIKRTSAMTVCERYSQHCFEQNDSHGQDIADRIFDDIVEIPTADVVEVKHGEWNLEVHSFYMDTWDESPELCVYILASCSNCGKEHSPKEVFSMNIYAPEDADCDYRFDKEYEETKALKKFKERNYEFQNFCSHCGADMRKEGAYNG
jgi:hypothetical protein